MSRLPARDQLPAVPLSASIQEPPTAPVCRRVSLCDLDDAGLARAAIEGDPGAPAVVFQRYGGLVAGLLRRCLGPSADVEDQLQETFVWFFRDVKKLRDPAALRAFLLGVATRVARSELRRRRFRRWLMLSDSGTLPDAVGTDADAEAREAVRRLYALLDRLDDRSRMLFVLRYVEGLELTDVASALGISLATIKRSLAKVSACVHAMAARDPLLSAYVAPVPRAMPSLGGEQGSSTDDRRFAHEATDA